MTTLPAMWLALACSGHVVSGPGPDGNLLLLGDETAESLHIRVAWNGHLIVSGKNGTLIDDKPLRDFGVVQQLPFHPYRGDLEVRLRGGADEITWDTRSVRFRGNAILDGGIGSDTIRVSGDIEGSLLAKGLDFWWDENDFFNMDGDRLEVKNVICTDTLGVSGSWGADQLTVESCRTGLCAIQAGDGEMTFNGVEYFSLYLGAPGDFISVGHIQADNAVQIYASEGNFYGDGNDNFVEAQNVFAGSGITVFVNGSQKGFCHLQHLHSRQNEVACDAPVLIAQDVRGESCAITARRLFASDVHADESLFFGTVDDRSDLAPRSAEKAPQTPGVESSEFSDGPTIVWNVSAGVDIMAGARFDDFVELRQASAGRDILLRGSHFTMSDLKAGRDLVKFFRSYDPNPVAFRIQRADIGRNLDLYAYEEIELEQVVVGGRTDLLLDYTDQGYDNHLTVRNCRFSGQFVAVTWSGNDYVELINNVFLKPGSYVDGGTNEAGGDLDLLWAVGNVPVRNLQFQNFEFPPLQPQKRR